MRMTLSIDSATSDEAKDFIFAWQRTRHFGNPASLSEEPTVRMAGIGWGVTLPPCRRDRAEAIMADFREARDDAETQTQTATPTSQEAP